MNQQTNWPLLFGLVSPPTSPGQLPSVPHWLYGSSGRTGSVQQRRIARERRMDAEVAYLREYGPLLVSALAHAFGLTPEAMTNDMRLLEAAGRVRQHGTCSPKKMEAMP